jgi:hypothetical protein
MLLVFSECSEYGLIVRGMEGLVGEWMVGGNRRGAISVQISVGQVTIFSAKRDDEGFAISSYFVGGASVTAGVIC